MLTYGFREAGLDMVLRRRGDFVLAPTGYFYPELIAVGGVLPAIKKMLLRKEIHEERKLN